MKLGLSTSRLLGLFLILLLGLLVFQFRGHPAAAWLFDRETSAHDTRRSCQPGGTVSGVIRNNGEGWYALDDEGHVSTNISRVESDWQQITIHFSFDAHRIQTFVVASDERFTANGIAAGASVGTDRARLVIARQGILGAGRVSPNWVHTGRFPSSNFWIYGTFDADCAA